MARVALVLCMLSAQVTLAGTGTWLEDKMVSAIDADVNIVMMRWGRLADGTDGIVLQTGSEKYKEVTLILNSADSTQIVRRLTIQTGVTACGVGRSNGRAFYCTACGKPNAKGASTTGGCIFRLSFPHDLRFRKMRVMSVLGNGSPVTYNCKFNVSKELMFSPFAVPVPPGAGIHDAESSFEDRSVELAASTPATPPSASKPVPATEDTNLDFKTAIDNTTWTWERRGVHESVTFLQEGVVKHPAFSAKWFVSGPREITIGDEKHMKITFNKDITAYKGLDFGGNELRGTRLH